MTNSSTKGKDLLNLLLLGASVPVNLLYVAPEKNRKEPINSLLSVVRFTSTENVFTSNKRSLIGMSIAFIVLSVGAMYWNASAWILLAYGMVMSYHLNLSFRLLNFEKGNRLVYDWEFDVYEYRSASGTVVFRNEDIRQITLHESGFSVRIADIQLQDQVVRITSQLVNFDQIPLLDANGVESKSHPFLFRLP